MDVPPTLALNENELPGAAPDSRPKLRVNDDVDGTDEDKSLPSGNAEPLCSVISGSAKAT